MIVKLVEDKDVDNIIDFVPKAKRCVTNVSHSPIDYVALVAESFKLKSKKKLPSNLKSFILKNDEGIIKIFFMVNDKGEIVEFDIDPKIKSELIKNMIEALKPNLLKYGIKDYLSMNLNASDLLLFNNAGFKNYKVNIINETKNYDGTAYFEIRYQL